MSSDYPSKTLMQRLQYRNDGRINGPATGHNIRNATDYFNGADANSNMIIKHAC